jgi:hypothetical protein
MFRPLRLWLAPGAALGGADARALAHSARLTEVVPARLRQSFAAIVGMA